MPDRRAAPLQGTLDLLILKALATEAAGWLAAIALATGRALEA